MALYFKPGIGEWLWENGISLEAFLENLKNVEDLDARLSLTDAGKDWLLLHSTFISEIELFLDENQYSSGTLAFAKNSILVLLNDGEVDFNNRLLYDSSLDQDYRSRMSGEEIEIFNTLSDFQKADYLKSAQQASNYANSYHGASIYNGKGDAVRHAFWNALSTVRLGGPLAKQLTDAHESGDLDPDYINHYKERNMDLFNNVKGIEIGNSSGRLYQLVEQALANGDLRYLSYLLGGGASGRATDSSQLIPTNQ